MTDTQEAQLRERLRLSNLHEVNAAITLLRDLEIVERPPLPLAFMRYVLQEIDHRFEPGMVESSTWSAVGDLAPRFSRVVDAHAAGDKEKMFDAMNALVAAWIELNVSIG